MRKLKLNHNQALTHHNLQSAAASKACSKLSSAWDSLILEIIVHLIPDLVREHPLNSVRPRTGRPTETLSGHLSKDRQSTRAVGCGRAASTMLTRRGLAKLSSAGRCRYRATAPMPGKHHLLDMLNGGTVVRRGEGAMGAEKRRGARRAWAWACAQWLNKE